PHERSAHLRSAPSGDGVRGEEPLGEVAGVRIAVVSEFRPTYSVAIEACYARALAALGHEIFEVPTFPRLAPRGGMVGRILGAWPARACQGELNSAVGRIRPDAIIVVKGLGILGATIRRWRRVGAHVMNLFPDN